MAYGGPDSLDDIKPYLENILSGREVSPHLVEEVRKRYALIGGKSPLPEITYAQARALEKRLNAPRDDPESAPSFKVYVGMRHWRPYICKAVARIAEDGLRDVIALCMAPHYSKMSVGAYFQKLQDVQEALEITLNVIYVKSYHNHPLFIRAIVEKVKAALERFPPGVRSQVRVLFTAHSLPVSLVKQGDPYDTQLQETARLVAARLGLGDDTWQLCYQSVGTSKVKWLGPQVEDVIQELAVKGHNNILVAPIGFVADNVELLYEIDIVCRNLAASHGVHLERVDSLNASPTFIEALADIVHRAVSECQR